MSFASALDNYGAMRIDPRMRAQANKRKGAAMALVTAKIRATQDWQSFFHTRNRIIAGLLHSDRPKSGKLLQNSGRQDIKKLLNMQYYATQLAVDGMRSVLRGPDGLHDGISQDMPAARARATTAFSFFCDAWR